MNDGITCSIKNVCVSSSAVALSSSSFSSHIRWHTATLRPLEPKYADMLYMKCERYVALEFLHQMMNFHQFSSFIRRFLPREKKLVHLSFTRYTIYTHGQPSLFVYIFESFICGIFMEEMKVLFEYSGFHRIHSENSDSFVLKMPTESRLKWNALSRNTVQRRILYKMHEWIMIYDSWVVCGVVATRKCVPVNWCVGKR